MIPVTKPFLPPLGEYENILREIWDRGWITNNGPVVNELELKLKEYLQLNHLLYLSNGTIALQIAIKALQLEGEIITTPFSYVATTNSIIWENCKPVFVDIDEQTLNINPALIVKAITDKTTGILATHVYGNPCEIDEISKIAERFNLKVIYDAAHCFGTSYKSKSVLEYGDISTISFHATKLFHTIEGGAVITKDPKLTETMAKMRNFGHDGPNSFSLVGINGKNSEFHAAMGILNLNYIDEILERRKKQYLYYLESLPKGGIKSIIINPNCQFNYAYFPIIFENEKQLEQVISELNKNYVYPRRYFFPSLNTLHYVNGQHLKVSENISPRVLCLPLFHALAKNTQEMIMRVIKRTLKYN